MELNICMLHRSC